MNACDCEHGWRWVAPEYAEHLAAKAIIGTAVPSRAVVAALANSVYPCRECQPATFDRWAAGHFAKGHEMDDCPECAAVRGGRHRGGSKRTKPTGNFDNDSGPPMSEPPHDWAEPEPRRDLF
jgi:hypothetical protein